jgi:carbohydrate kinase (thermoresistant glucokinase family)
VKALVIMGVSGSGKSTVGRLLARKTGGRFVDGDDHHPPANVRKMSAGIPLDDQDRFGWLEKLASLIREADGLTIIACSALKERYREMLAGAELVFLDGSPELIRERLENRSDHFMPPNLLRSQFEDLERPAGALTLDVALSPPELVRQIIEAFGLEEVTR